MGLEIQFRDNGAIRRSGVVDIHPLSRYVFDSRDAAPERDDNPADRVRRRESTNAAHGLRTCVGGVLLVDLFKEPHVLLLQVRNSFFKLPGGRLRRGEPEIEGLKRKLSSKLSPRSTVQDDNWQTGEFLGNSWSDMQGSTHLKECTKIFLVRLPRNKRFVVPRNLKLLAVPLGKIRDCPEVYGPVISLIPELLSGFSFNKVEA